MPSEAEELSVLVDICHSNLKSSKDLCRYLIKDRGMTKETLIENKIGYFPQSVETLLGYVSDGTMSRLNILNMMRNSDFSSYFYLVFPIFTEYGEPIGISGRTLLSTSERQNVGIPKYKNSSYKKADILYGLNNSQASILEKNEVFVVEGYFDYLSLVQSGIKNCVAICGTAFSQNHFVKLARYTDKITFVLDNDEAGISSAKRIYEKYINKGIKLRFLASPPDIKDVDEYFSIKNKNKDTFFSDFRQTIPDLW